VSFRIVIPSARASNLIPCVQSILACEPDLSPSDMLVVDDGARVAAEGVLPPVTWVPGVQPFVFARNVNLGILAAGLSDVVLLNDDARLLTPSGFTQWSAQMRHWPDVGVCSAGIQGTVCNPRQRAVQPSAFRDEPHQLAFICVYLPRTAIDRVGLLDEQFTGYGFEDFDYCRRVIEAGLRLTIWDGCVVDHTHDDQSTYRTRPDIQQLFDESHTRYREKWDTVLSAETLRNPPR
jgi:hypothetical protein